MGELEFITVACDDPDELADFWAAVLDGTVRDMPASVEPAIVDTPDDGPDMLFRDLPKGTERDLPIHLDVAVDDREGAEQRFRDLGASVRETKTEQFGAHTHTWTVMEDPEGNGFCIAER